MLDDLKRGVIATAHQILGPLKRLQNNYEEAEEMERRAYYNTWIEGQRLKWMRTRCQCYGYCAFNTNFVCLDCIDAAGITCQHWPDYIAQKFERGENGESSEYEKDLSRHMNPESMHQKMARMAYKMQNRPSVEDYRQNFQLYGQIAMVR